MSSYLRWVPGPGRLGGGAGSRPWREGGLGHEHELASEQTLLLDAIASLSYAVAAYAATGECQYRRVAGGPPDDSSTALLGAMEALAHSLIFRRAASGVVEAGPEVGRVGVVAVEVPTANGRFGLRAIRFRPGVFGSESSVLVTAERLRDEAIDRSRIRERFGLTEREAEVAALLADRRSNAEIARALGISEHTARHHTEHVLAKLRAGGRHEVRRILHAATDAGVEPPRGADDS